MNFLKTAYLLMISIVLLACSNATKSTYLSHEESNQIKEEVLTHAKKWLNSWNGTVDSEQMMSTYHRNMKYAWRGNIPLGTFDDTKTFAESLPEMSTNFQLTMNNMNYTIIDKNNAVIFFQFDDENKSPLGIGAASLVMTKTDDKWKIIYVHESTIEPLE